MKQLASEIKQNIQAEVRRIKADKDLMSRLYIITLACALLVLAVTSRGPEEKGKVLSDASGNAIEIERHSLETGENYDFEVSISDGNETLSKDVNLRLQALNQSDNSKLRTELSREHEIQAALDRAVNEIEYSREKRIRLPDELSDGIKICWRAMEKKDYTALALIPIIYIALVIFVIRYSGERSAADEKTRRKSIIRGLPRFCNQLYLMMNAGMILSDAFDLISSKYEESVSKEKGSSSSGKDYFQSELARMRAKYPDRRKSSAGIINEFAIQNDVKEMIRIATILTENEKRGSDVIESLSRESRYLWDERKIVARETGKMIDSKMSYPLGILLILLIVITMAPVMLSM